MKPFKERDQSSFEDELKLLREAGWEVFED